MTGSLDLHPSKAKLQALDFIDSNNRALRRVQCERNKSEIPWLDASRVTFHHVAPGLALQAAASGQGVAPVRMSLAWRRIARGELVDLFAVRSAAHDGYSLSVQNAGALALDFAQWLRRECALLDAASFDK